MKNPKKSTLKIIANLIIRKYTASLILLRLSHWKSVYYREHVKIMKNKIIHNKWLKYSWHFFYSWVFFAILLSILFALLAYFFHSRQSIYIYAWERPENLSFLDSIEHKKTTVVYYAGDIVIDHGRANISPRRNSLIIPEDINKIPLIRIDNFNNLSALHENSKNIVDFIANTCRDVSECQLDFDAKKSEYIEYAEILTTIKQRLPKIKITITALASWCGKNSWLEKMLIDDAVPMLYRMGNSPSIKNLLNDGGITSYAKCGHSVALSTDELNFKFKQYLNRHNIYLFNPDSWTEENYMKVKDKLKI